MVQYGPVYEIEDCSILTTEGGQHGVLIETTQNFEIALVLDQRMRARVKACIEQIDTPHPEGGTDH